MDQLRERYFDLDSKNDNPKEVLKLQNELQEISKSKEKMVTCLGKTKATDEEMKKIQMYGNMSKGMFLFFKKKSW
jgi:hypothetical protein